MSFLTTSFAGALERVTWSAISFSIAFSICLTSLSIPTFAVLASFASVFLGLCFFVLFVLRSRRLERPGASLRRREEREEERKAEQGEVLHPLAMPT